MATLVQQPELAQVQTSNLQATQRPEVQEAGLSDFALGLLGAGNKFLDAYNEENKDRLIALGISDYMNNDTREVSWLERRNYQQGMSFGTVMEAQTQRRKAFTSELDRMIAAGETDQEKIFEANQEFLQSTVDDIYNSELDSDLKEKLYQETLKENVQYQKLIGEKLQEAAINKYTSTSRLLGAKTIADLMTLPKTPQEQVEYVNTQFEQIKAHATASGFAKTEQEAHDAATTTLKGSFQFWFESIDPKAPDANESFSRLRGVAENLFVNGQPELANDILTKLNDAQVEVLNFNDDMLNRDLTLDLHNFSIGQVDYTPEQLASKFNQYAQSGKYTNDTLTNWYSKYLNVIEERTKKALEGDSEQNILQYDNYLSAGHNGITKDKWLKTTLQDAAREAAESGNNTFTGVGLNLIDRATRASVYMPELIQMAMEQSTAELAQWARMPEADLKASGGFDSYQQNWNGLVQRYQYLSANNPQAAEDMIAAIDEKHFPNKEVLRGLLQTGAPLYSAYKALQDPVGTAQRLANVKTAIGKLDIESAKLDHTFTLGNNGKWFNRINEQVKENFLGSMQVQATRYQGIIAPYMTSGNPSNLMNAMERSGLMVRTSKYTPVMVNPTVGNMINSNSVRNTKGEVINKEYIGQAIDGWRDYLATRYGQGVKAENIIVQEQGGAFYFLLHDKEGNLQNVTPYLGLQGSEVSMSLLISTASKLKDGDAKRSQEQVIKVKQPNQNKFGVLGFGTAAQTSSAPEYLTVRPQATLQRGAVREHGTGRLIPVNYPNQLAAPFGYNKQLAVQLANTWNNFESWVDKPTEAKAQAGTTSTTSNVIGWGVTKRWHPEIHAQMTKAKSTQERMNILANYLPTYYSKAGLDKIVASAGLPQPTTKPYPKHLEGVYTMIADATWHGGGGGGRDIATALKQPTLDQAVRSLKSSTVYRSIKGTDGSFDSHPRNIWRVNTLRQYYNSKSLMGGGNVSLGGKTLTPSKIPNKVFVPYKP